jgi:hypothetical protein
MIGGMIIVPYAIQAIFNVAIEITLHMGVIALVVLAVFFGRMGWMGSLMDRLPAAAVLICLTEDGLEVTRGRRRAEVFPVLAATLGAWTTTGGALMGTALHLQKARHRFVLGGRNHRVPMGTRLDAQPMWNADAWMRAAAGCKHQVPLGAFCGWP